MRIFPSVCTLDTFPHICIKLQANPVRGFHAPPTRHTLHHAPHTPSSDARRAQGAKGYYYCGRQEKERMGCLISHLSLTAAQSQRQNTLQNTHDTAHHTPHSLMFGKGCH